MPSDSPESKLNPHPSDASRTELTQSSDPLDSRDTGNSTSQLRIDSERESLELELFRLKREADAARHEAQAARCDAEAASIELKLRGLDTPHPETPIRMAASSPAAPSHASPQPTDPARTADDPSHAAAPLQADLEPDQNTADVTWYTSPILEKPASTPLEPEPAKRELSAAALTSTSFQSWQEIREAFDQDVEKHRAEKQDDETPIGDASDSPDATEKADATTSKPSAGVTELAVVEEPNIQPDTLARIVTETREDHAAAPQRRVDSAHRQASAPRFRDAVSPDERSPAVAAGETSDAPSVCIATAKPTATESASSLDPASLQIPSLDSGEKPIEKANIADLKSEFVADDTATPEDRRRKPAAWIASVIVHAVILVILGVVTLQTHKPLDQVTLSASAPSASEVSMETFSIESSELETEPTEEQTESEIQYDLSPVGEIAVSDFKPPPPPSMPSPAAAMLSQSDNSAAAMLTKPSDSDAKIQFCGVDGGGNHFVYLVDSSKSMGDA
ncbi:hypothetical protein, partial [Novipirellula sp.]|uniref:hypothetical protein n=1 Tax=Novipirellula sp. TaxID=2795430 RepID=UPI003564837D